MPSNSPRQDLADLSRFPEAHGRSGAH
jgi:hypothetical protein